MLRHFAPYLARLDSVYRGRSYFVGLKARLLGAITLLVLAFVLFNIAKNVWLQPPVILPRIAVNLIVGIAGMVCLRSLLKGKLESAGNGLALAMVLAVHGTVLLVGATTRPLQPISVGIQVFAFDMVFLMFAILFASRCIATVVFVLMMAGQVGYYLFMLRKGNLASAAQISADTLLRDGLLAMGLLFCLGIATIQMIEAAHRRSEESLRQSQSANDNLKRLEQEARILAEQRREFLEMQREFIAMVSHEFRSPLTAIQGARSLLEKLLRESAGLSGTVAEKTEKWLGLQASELKRLNELVEQVLALNRIEHMAGEASMALLSPGQVLAETVGRFNDSTDTPRVVLVNDVPSGFDASMNPGLVKATAENLISNGLKYSGSEKLVQVRVYTEPGGWGVDVVDQGRGIPSDDQTNLFHPFFRAGNVGTVPGAGLGLAIVRRAVDFHGGHIEFESKENVGTSFKLRFPSVARTPSLYVGRVPLIHRD